MIHQISFYLGDGSRDGGFRKISTHVVIGYMYPSFDHGAAPGVQVMCRENKTDLSCTDMIYGSEPTL